MARRGGTKSKPARPAGRPRAARAPAGPPLHVFLRRRRALRGYGALAALVALLLLSWADHRGWLLYAGDELARYDGAAWHVTRVIDGDTLDIAAPDGGAPYTRVRFWGINAPEVAHEGSARPAEPFGDEAAAFLRRSAQDRTVRLRLEPHQVRDRFGRLLAHVELEDGTDLGEALLQAGLARADDRWSHSRLERHAALEREAREQGVGMWARPRR